MRFRVRVNIKGAGIVVLPGDTDAIGPYIELRPNVGTGYYAKPGKRLSIDKDNLRPLPNGSDADFEFLGPPLPADALEP